MQFYRPIFLHKRAVMEPASEIQDKILFMINNISASNMDVKAKEFTDVLKEQYYPWFAQYMVMKRASIEPNFHELYLKFLEKVNSRMLNKKIVKATYENCCLSKTFLLPLVVIVTIHLFQSPINTDK
ncbi:uncharacterized protein LOC131256857 isoform X1 [Magnolia sinica]|uniref:uncharacterized protein LOC131256857 isoform X1 n=1 Tax=Magnolia sinica TaxID=86752 RepID=UPI00265A4C1E|nr:uncharacterized protein LOC131256857 isoform X1 [Magnolia sinica]